MGGHMNNCPPPAGSWSDSAVFPQNAPQATACKHSAGIFGAVPLHTRSVPSLSLPGHGPGAPQVGFAPCPCGSAVKAPALAWSHRESGLASGSGPGGRYQGRSRVSSPR